MTTLSGLPTTIPIRILTDCGTQTLNFLTLLFLELSEVVNKLFELLNNDPNKQQRKTEHLVSRQLR